MLYIMLRRTLILFRKLLKAAKTFNDSINLLKYQILLKKVRTFSI